MSFETKVYIRRVATGPAAMSSVSLLLSFAFLCVAFLTVEAAIKSDEVFNLPGLKVAPKFRQFSGYLKATGLRRLHYWFVESQGDPSKDPVILWLNGGPGCSSLDGFLSEHGPFLVADDGKTLNENQYSWNKLANIIYLEAPAGVGYSYAVDKNYTTNDDQTSLDNYWALKYFFSNYPEFSTNEFYITGESYGGIYVPTLSVRVAADNNFNFKGFAVGNGIGDWSLNDDSLVYFAYYHGLLSEKEWLNIVASCCDGGNSTVGNCVFGKTNSSTCEKALVPFGECLNGLNIYDLFDECHPAPPPLGSVVVHPHQLFLSVPGQHRVDLKKLLASNTSLAVVPPCVNVTGITNYLNTRAVRRALHIPDDLPTWSICSAIDYKKQYTSMRNQYVNLLSLGKLKMMLYNGDADMACNFLGEEWFVDSLPLKMKEKRSHWFYKALDGTKQIAGTVQKFNDFTFLTVKGAGHMVPQDKPIQAFQMLSNFLSGEF